MNRNNFYGAAFGYIIYADSDLSTLETDITDPGLALSKLIGSDRNILQQAVSLDDNNFGEKVPETDKAKYGLLAGYKFGITGIPGNLLKAANSDPNIMETLDSIWELVELNQTLDNFETVDDTLTSPEPVDGPEPTIGLNNEPEPPLELLDEYEPTIGLNTEAEPEPPLELADGHEPVIGLNNEPEAPIGLDLSERINPIDLNFDDSDDGETVIFESDDETISRSPIKIEIKKPEVLFTSDPEPAPLPHQRRRKGVAKHILSLDLRQ